MGDEIDEAAAASELTGLTPEEFTGRRNQLAKALKANGQKEAAARLAQLRKPSVHLWAANHLARERGLAVTRLLSAAADLAQAQEGAFSGKEGAGQRLRRDSGAYQRALDLAVREGTGLLRDGGRSSTEETARRLRDILAGAALGDEELRSQLAGGTLLSEPPPPGAAAFGFAGDLAAPAPAEKRRKGSAGRPAAGATAAPVPVIRREDHRRVLEARKAAEAAAVLARRLAEVARRARRRADSAAAEAASADREASGAEADANRAARESEAAAAALEGLLGR